MIVRVAVYDGDVEGDLPPQVEDVVPILPLLLWDGGAELEGPLVVEEGGRQDVELMHGSAKVVVRLLWLNNQASMDGALPRVQVP